MKLIIDISEGIYKHVDTIQNGSIGAKQIINSVKNGIPAYKAIPSAEPYKGMTNGEVIKAMFPNIPRTLEWHIHNVTDDDWWNSSYEPQEISDRNLKMWHDIYAEEKRRTERSDME